MGIVADGEFWVNTHKSCCSDTLTPVPLMSLCVHSHILFPVVHLQRTMILMIDLGSSVTEKTCNTERAPYSTEIFRISKIFTDWFLLCFVEALLGANMPVCGTWVTLCFQSCACNRLEYSLNATMSTSFL